MMQALLPILSCCLLAMANEHELPIRLAAPDELSFQDSIPEKAGERVVVYVDTMQAHWVVTVVNVSYEWTRERIRDLVDKTFGIESEGEHVFNGEAQRRVHPHMPKEPLFGDGFGDFWAIGIPIVETREYRIDSAPYNTQVRWWESSSRSEWRIIDGRLLFGKTCTILVISRTDHSREWAKMHPGIPLPFTLTWGTKLVTDKELALVDTLLNNAGRPQIHYFVPHTGYKTNGVLNVMRAIYEAAKELPEPGMKSDGS